MTQSNRDNKALIIKSNFNLIPSGFLTQKKLIAAFNGKKAELLHGKKRKITALLFKNYRQLKFIPSQDDIALMLLFSKKQFGPFPGCNWKISFKPIDKATLKYQVFVPSDFDFVKGGKLPGLAGGLGNTGGLIPNGSDGWSVRFMFKENGTLCAYAYYPDMHSDFGEKLFLMQGNFRATLKTGQWNQIELSIKMNQAHLNNGGITARLNGEGLISRQHLNFRKTEMLKIDHLLFSCFMGGDDNSYAPNKDQSLLFKNFIITQ
jgi:hypothetical protein